MSNQADFLFELGTEELPPVALKKLSDAFTTEVKDSLAELKLNFKSVTSFASPRRLALLVTSIDTKQADIAQTKLGPAKAAAFDADGKPTRAAEGFARSCGVTVSELTEIDTDKGVRLGIQTTEEGKPATELLPGVITKALSKLPIPKTMRWGSRNDSFVRPVKWVVALLDSNIIPMELFGCHAGRLSRGHRFMGSGEVEIDKPENYERLLNTVYVQPSQTARMDIISKQVTDLASEHNLTAVIDENLLEEVSALVEWPVALMGRFEESFLRVPQEALISTMSKNQKYFHLLDDKGQLAARFITISNIESHKPDSIITGNEKVIRPRLADAQFFYEQDCKHSLSSKAKLLDKIVFQNQLGTVADKTKRLTRIANTIAEQLGWDSELLNIAGPICKADLVSEMVKEFPSLQGVMGKYYARVEGLDDEVATSLEEIYLPRHAGDDLPQTRTGILLALSDRLDTLAGIFSINQIPTGNKDPFALRRATLGVVRIILEHRLPLSLDQLLSSSLSLFDCKDESTTSELKAFFVSRIRAMYVDQGVSTQVFNAVEQTGIDSIIDVDLRITAVSKFNTLAEAEALAAANKRVANILAKNQREIDGLEVSEQLLTEDAEQSLFTELVAIESSVIDATNKQDYQAALETLSQLKVPLDRFFDQVMVMSDDEAVMLNRLNLLRRLRTLFLSVADISLLQI
jgi:glycyl-tRNA synthetase beta chain